MTRLPRNVIAFNTADAEPKETVVCDPRLVDRPYHARSWRLFSNPEKGALAGIWEAESHLERVNCSNDELCHLLEGTVRLTDANGASQMFHAGETFVVASGFEGTWENLGRVRKIFFILD